MVSYAPIMEKCGVPKGVLIGEGCRLIPGEGVESCYFATEVECEKRESRGTVGHLEGLIKRSVGCPFQKEVLKRIEGKRSGGA